MKAYVSGDDSAIKGDEEEMLRRIENSAVTNSKNRPSIFLLNHGNMHWTPVCFLCDIINDAGVVIGIRQAYVFRADQFNTLRPLFA